MSWDRSPTVPELLVQRHRRPHLAQSDRQQLQQRVAASQVQRRRGLPGRNQNRTVHRCWAAAACRTWAERDEVKESSGGVRLDQRTMLPYGVALGVGLRGPVGKAPPSALSFPQLHLMGRP